MTETDREDDRECFIEIEGEWGTTRLVRDPNAPDNPDFVLVRTIRISHRLEGASLPDGHLYVGAFVPDPDGGGMVRGAFISTGDRPDIVMRRAESDELVATFPPGTSPATVADEAFFMHAYFPAELRALRKLALRLQDEWFII